MFTAGKLGTSLMSMKSLKTPKTRDEALSISNRPWQTSEHCNTYDRFILGQKALHQTFPTENDIQGVFYGNSSISVIYSREQKETVYAEVKASCNEEQCCLFEKVKSS